MLLNEFSGDCFEVVVTTVMIFLPGHEATSDRRKAGLKPYSVTEAKTGGFAAPSASSEALPSHLQTCANTRIVPVFKLVRPSAPAFRCPTGCTLLSPMASRDADLFLLEEFSDMDLADLPKQAVHSLVHQEKQNHGLDLLIDF